MTEALGRPLVALSEDMRTATRHGESALDELSQLLTRIDRDRKTLRDTSQRQREGIEQLMNQLQELGETQRQLIEPLAELRKYVHGTQHDDPKLAELVERATRRASDLMSSLSELASHPGSARALSLLRPLLSPLVRRLGEMYGGDDPDSAPDGDSGGA
jgi:methyl-accepting chemotaxis protein